MDSLATTITSIAAELTLEFIGGACLHKSVEPACCWPAQFCGACSQAEICRACFACLHQVWGVCLHTSKIQFILKLCNFCCYFFCNHFRVQWALLAADSWFFWCNYCSAQLTEKEFHAVSGDMLDQLQEKIEVCKIILHYFFSWRNLCTSTHHWSIAKFFFITFALENLSRNHQSLGPFFDVTNIQPEPEKSSRNLLTHLVDSHFQSSRNLCMQSGWLVLSLSYTFEEPWESLYHLCTTNFLQLKNPSLSSSCIQILKVFGVLSVPV